MSEANAGSALDRLIERLSSPPGIAAAWLLYGLLFSAIYFAFTRTLALDDAVSAELMQRHLAPAYQIRNPPAFEWMLWAVQQVFGPGLISFVILRYGLIGAFGVLTFIAVRQATGDRILAVAFSLSLPLFYWLGWDFHYRVTHSLGLLVFGLGAWIALISYRQTHAATHAALAGLLIGAALVSKWNGAIFFGAVLVVFLCDAKSRAALCRWQAALIPLAALFPLAPPVLWLLARQSDVADGLAARIIVEQPDYLLIIGGGVLDLAVAIILFLLPWGAVIGGAAAFARVRPVHNGSDAGALALRVTAVTVLTALCLVPVIGAVHTDFRYMYPLFLVFPVAAAAWLSGRVDSARFARLVVGVSMCAVALAAVLRAGALNQPDAGRASRQEALRPYDVLAHEVARMGLAEADIVTADTRDAGNLASLLPRARVRALNSQREDAPPPAPGLACLVLWHGNTAHISAPNVAATIPDAVRALAGDRLSSGAIPLAADWRKPLWGPTRRTTWFALTGESARPVCAAAR